jgi:hypothetical protein
VVALAQVAAAVAVVKTARAGEIHHRLPFSFSCEVAMTFSAVFTVPTGK